MKKNELSEKQKNFVAEYLKDNNASQAAIRAGYSAKTSANNIHRLMDNELVKAEIAKKKQGYCEKIELSVERCLLEYKRLAFHDLRKAFDDNSVLKPVKEWDDDTAAAISGVEAEELYSGRGDSRENIGRLSKVKLASKQAALDSLMKHLGGFEKDNAQKAANTAATLESMKAAASMEEKSKLIKSILTA